MKHEVAMRDAQDGNAMTEIALALAMAFFSIMVLAMLSMGSGMAEEVAEAVALPRGFDMRPVETGESSATAVSKEALLIHYGGRFLDARLKPTTPENFAERETIVLALDPALSMTEALAVRARVPRDNVTVTTLDDDWLKALKEMDR